VLVRRFPAPVHMVQQVEVHHIVHPAAQHSGQIRDCAPLVNGHEANLSSFGGQLAGSCRPLDAACSDEVSGGGGNPWDSEGPRQSVSAGTWAHCCGSAAPAMCAAGSPAAGPPSRGWKRSCGPVKMYSNSQRLLLDGKLPLAYRVRRAAQRGMHSCSHQDCTAAHVLLVVGSPAVRERRAHVPASQVRMLAAASCCSAMTFLPAILSPR
jgi:hypothetical protein